MKYIFTLFFISSSFFSFGQFSFDDLLGIYKMDFDQFETYSLKNGYSFENSDSTYGAIMLTYSKFGDSGSRIKLAKLSNSKEESIVAVYEIWNSMELLKFKDDLKKNGFKFLKTRKQDESIIKTYSNKLFDINIKSEKDFAWDLDVYSISLSRHSNE